MTFFGDRVDPSMSGVHIEFNARRAPEDGYRVAEVGLIREAFGIAGSPDC
jgi:hypothetical protein